MANLWLRLREAGIEIVSSHDASHADAASARDMVAGSGIDRRRTVAHRNFDQKGEVRVGFVPKGTTDAALPRVIRWMNFAVNAVVFAVVIQHLGLKA
jgi:hypothetical protein